MIDVKLNKFHKIKEEKTLKRFRNKYIIYFNTFEKANKKKSDNSEYRNEFIVNECGWIQKNSFWNPWISMDHEERKGQENCARIRACKNGARKQYEKELLVNAKQREGKKNIERGE